MDSTRQRAALRALASVLIGLAAVSCSQAGEAVPAGAVEPSPQPPLAGGWTPGDPAGAETMAAARAAAAGLPGDGDVAGIEAVEQQVVAGLNYRLTLLLTNRQRWDVTVWRRLDGSHVLTRSVRLADLVEPAMALSAEGLAVTVPGGGERTIPFGTARESVMQALAFRGPAGESTNAECGAGPMQFASWPDGVNLLFRDGQFSGWHLDSRAEGMALAQGIGIGSTLADLRRLGRVRVEDTTLGHEFTWREGMSGLLDGTAPKARVTDLWAGMDCAFR